MSKITTLTTAEQAAHGGYANEAMFLLSFVVVLCLAVVGQLMFFKWRNWFPGAESETSLIKGVRVGVDTFLAHLNQER